MPGLWAIGDLVGPPWLAHKAMHEGVIVAERIAGVKGVHPLDPSKVPGCTYCWPQVASIGMTEAKAKASGRKIKVGRFPFIGNGKAIALGDAEGLVKTVFDADTGELLGAHMIGAEVTELIQGYAIARTGELTEAELGVDDLPASHAVGNDARSRARCRQEGAAYLEAVSGPRPSRPNDRSSSQPAGRGRCGRRRMPLQSASLRTESRRIGVTL